MTMLYIKGIIKQQSVAAKQKRYLFIILKKKKKQPTLSSECMAFPWCYSNGNITTELTQIKQIATLALKAHK